MKYKAIIDNNFQSKMVRPDFVGVANIATAEVQVAISLQSTRHTYSLIRSLISNEVCLGNENYKLRLDYRQHMVQLPVRAHIKQSTTT